MITRGKAHYQSVKCFQRTTYVAAAKKLVNKISQRSPSDHQISPQGGASFVDPFFICILCHTVLSVHCSLVVTCWERADLLALVCDCVFVTFPCSILGQVWYLIVSIPDLCRLSSFQMLSADDTTRQSV